ncbi:hypothetical protein L6V77_07645 [Myxococcota bacterium]|nr:hypothetical protein [Myxococcota bacterium]
MVARVALVWSFCLPGCAFPEALTCRADADCRAPAVCVSGRCADPDGPGDADDGDGDGPGAGSPDARPDAAPPSAPAGFCETLCPEPGPCKALVPLSEGGFEDGEGDWVFTAPARRANRTVDLLLAPEGRFLGEALVDGTLAAGVDATRFEQRLPVEMLPAGDYRLCFTWRVVTGFDNCDSGHAPTLSVLALDAAGERSVWARTADEVCASAAPAGGQFDVTAWAEACVDVRRESAWSSPGLAFGAARTGEYDGARHQLAFDIDDVRLAAAACVTWR